MSRLASPPPQIAPWEWAEKHRILPKDSAEPGPMRATRTPWVKPITEAIINPFVREVITVQGSQTSKTDGVLLSTIGLHAHYYGSPMMLFAPTEDAISRISIRLHRMFESVPEIWDAVDKRNKSKYLFVVNSVPIILGWGGSASQVASQPAKIVLFDELDRLKDIPGEGNAWQLTKARKSTYIDGKHIGASSPTLGLVDDYRHSETGLIHWQVADPKKIISLSWQLWQEGTKGEFMLPCPHCGQYFAPKSKLLYFPSVDSPDIVQKQARLICPHCSAEIHPNHQYSMISKGLMICPGQWVENGQIMGEIPTNPIASFHVNGLCSPWLNWSERALQLWRVVKSGNKGRIQVALNTEFGELYGEQGESPPWESIAEQRHESNYEMGEIPEPVQVLTAGVDVQRDRLVVVVMGWAVNDGQLEGYVVQYEELLGKTHYDDVWDMLQASYFDSDINGMFIREIGVDSGFNPSSLDRDRPNRNIIYDYCRRKPRAVATKGASRVMDKPFSASKVDVSQRGKQEKRGLTLWTLDTDFLKREVYARLQWDLTRAGRWHYPKNLPLQFFKELTAEQLTDTGQWVATGANHVLDAVVINYFLALKLRLAKTLHPKTIAAQPVRPTKSPPQQVRKVVHGDDFY